MTPHPIALRSEWLFDVVSKARTLAVSKEANDIRLAQLTLAASPLEELIAAALDAQLAHHRSVRDPSSDSRPTSLSLKPLDLVTRALSLIASNGCNAQRGWRLRDFCRAVGCSRTQLEIAFKTIAGMSVHRYVVHVRVQRAKQLLIETDLKIESIAREVGYSSKPAFYDAFHRTVGLTPLRFRSEATTRGGG